MCKDIILANEALQSHKDDFKSLDKFKNVLETEVNENILK